MRLQIPQRRWHRSLTFARAFALLVLALPVFALLPLFSLSLLAQSDTGELRLRVTDPAGLGVKTSIVLLSQSNEYRQVFTTSDSVDLDAAHLPFGLYRITVNDPRFAPASQIVEIRSDIPISRELKLALPSLKTSVIVQDQTTLIDPRSTSGADRIGAQAIEDRPASLPGRSVLDLVNSQPGWLFEGNGVLHPRGSEYQTQFVIDGIPLSAC